jgi:hypothetical protein
MVRFIVVLLAFACGLSSAEARRHAISPPVCIPTSDVMRPCAYQSPNFLSGVREIRVQMRRVPRARHHRFDPAPTIRNAVEEAAGYATKMLPHPDGCPAVAFCGCGAARELGLADRSLWLAAEWTRFKRAMPGYNKVGVAPGRHHVLVLKEQVSGSLWLVADYNAGHHRSMLHVRDIARYTIVDPHP